MMGATGERFTVSDYQAILNAARDHGYRFARFTDPAPAPGSRVVYLRHDVDNCIDSALLMAELEARGGVQSTYLVLVRSQNYNPFSGENVKRLKRIHGLGHEVGLHFTAEEHDSEALASDLVSCVQRDARLLECALSAPVRVFSFHNPGDNRGFTVDVPGLVNAYAPRFFADACYLSESNMRWRDGSPIGALASGEHPVVQILVHPLSYREAFQSDRDVLLWFIRDVTRTLLATNVRQNRVLREQGVSLAEVAAYLLERDAPPHP
jgi:hypothetical protein